MQRYDFYLTLKNFIRINCLLHRYKTKSCFFITAQSHSSIAQRHLIFALSENNLKKNTFFHLKKLFFCIKKSDFFEITFARGKNFTALGRILLRKGRRDLRRKQLLSADKQWYSYKNAVIKSEIIYGGYVFETMDGGSKAVGYI